jgi:DNA uptake protein ComE-like DNA-binding protein
MWKKINHQIRNYFPFSHIETRAFIPMYLLMGLILVAPLLWRTWVKPHFSTHESDRVKLDSLIAGLEMHQSVAEKRRAHPSNGYRPYHRPEPRLFAFDPNTIGALEWQQLGLQRYLAERIMKYRSKGGKFRVKKDLLKIFDFPAERYAALKSYILLPDSLTPKGYPARNNAPLPSGSFADGRKNVASREDFRPQPFDLNSVDTVALDKVKGIGPASAGRIVRYRERLGGFVRQDQLFEVFGLDSLAALEVLKYASLGNGPLIKKLKVNTATVEELRQHPYFSPRLAKLVVAYRQQHGPFADRHALAQIKVLDARTLSKIEPYLSYEP